MHISLLLFFNFTLYHFYDDTENSKERQIKNSVPEGMKEKSQACVKNTIIKSLRDRLVKGEYIKFSPFTHTVLHPSVHSVSNHP
ncbi:hypothetical protein Q648_00922 [Bartonella quintana JK 12]|nr:hypothetical protein Q648_00922 [Bartonella quintana JK 12]ETS19405.1 hypothetical protein Q647_00065 [Bartonella quintana JK 7]KEC69089.1 hypothetical protein O7Q_00141 [Bartonella quintana JK 39]